MSLIYETTHFLIEAHDKPHVSREDGGHIVISPKIKVADVTKLSAEQAKEFVKLMMIAGEAMEKGMKKQGIELGRINYQMNANFKTEMHLHLYGRGLNAKIQKYGTVLQHGPSLEDFKKQIEGLNPLTFHDVNVIRQELTLLLETDKYKNF